MLFFAIRMDAAYICHPYVYSFAVSEWEMVSVSRRYDRDVGRLHDKRANAGDAGD